MRISHIHIDFDMYRPYEYNFDTYIFLHFSIFILNILILTLAHENSSIEFMKRPLLTFSSIRVNGRGKK